MVGAIRLSSFRPSGSNCRESEENCGDQAPEDPNGACNTETGERWVSRKDERRDPLTAVKPATKRVSPRPQHRAQFAVFCHTSTRYIP